MAKVSIIVPVYNVEKYLEKCLTSLVNQTLKDIEIIIVNDGTTDNSQDIIDDFKMRYPRLIKSFKKPNGGLSDARNFGIKKATGKYIGFVDSDDYIDKTMYEKLFDKIISKDFDMVVSNCYIVTGDKIIEHDSNIKCDLVSKKAIKKLFIDIYPTVWNKLYKKELFEDLDFKVGVWFEDVEFIYKLLPRLNKIGVVKESLYYYIQRDGSITAKIDNRIYNYVDNFNGLIDYYKKNNLYSRYYKELEYAYVRYIYATFIKRCLSFPYNDYQKALNTAIENVKSNFPKYRKNKYFYTSIKGIYLVLFTKKLGKILYKLK